MAKFKVDFSNVEDTVLTDRIPPGEYKAKVKSVTVQKKEGGEYPYLKWELVILTGPAKGLQINHITSLKPAALFNLRNTLVACGLEVPKAAVAIDTDKLTGKTLGIKVDIQSRNGGEYPTVVKVFRPDMLKEESSTGGTVATDDDEMVLDDDDLF